MNNKHSSLKKKTLFSAWKCTTPLPSSNYNMNQYNSDQLQSHKFTLDSDFPLWKYKAVLNE